jgi:MoxR-like ATPase
MKFTEIKQSIIETFSTANGIRHVPLIEGQPGGGKSALARDVGVSMGFENIHQVFLSLRDPTDLLGTPRNDGDVTRWIPPAELYRLREGRHLLVLEEFGDSPNAMQNAACGLIYDRKVNDLHLSPETYIIATTNRTKDKSGANRIVSKAYGRMCRYEFVENIDDWSDWALDAGPALPA